MVRASVFQTESCGFESHYPLNVETYSKFFVYNAFQARGRGFESHPLNVPLVGSDFQYRHSDLASPFT